MSQWQNRQSNGSGSEIEVSGGDIGKNGIVTRRTGENGRIDAIDAIEGLYAMSSLSVQSLPNKSEI
jgi:hypothetical protein